jgi:hypothetical protein
MKDVMNYLIEAKCIIKKLIDTLEYDTPRTQVVMEAEIFLNELRKMGL